MSMLRKRFVQTICVVVFCLPGLGFTSSGQEGADMPDLFGRVTQWFQSLKADQGDKSSSTSTNSTSGLQGLIDQLKVCTQTQVDKAQAQPGYDHDMPNMTIYLTAALQCAKEVQQKMMQ